MKSSYNSGNIKISFCPCFKQFLCAVPKAIAAICPELHKKKLTQSMPNQACSA